MPHSPNMMRSERHARRQGGRKELRYGNEKEYHIILCESTVGETCMKWSPMERDERMHETEELEQEEENFVTQSARLCAKVL